MVLEGSRTLLKAGNDCSYLTDALPTIVNKHLPTHECQLAALCDMAKTLLTVENSDAVLVQNVTGHADFDSCLDLFSCLTENHHDHAFEVMLLGEQYFLPPRSRFLLSDVTRLQPLVQSRCTRH